MLLTFLVTVFVDLITAVALGLIATGVVHSRDWARGEMDSVLSMPLLDPAFVPNLEDLDPHCIPVGLVMLKGHFSVGSANDLTRALAADIEDHEIVILDFSATTDVDDSAALAIGDLVQTALDEDTVCIVVGLSGDVAKVLHSLLVFRRVPRNISWTVSTRRSGWPAASLTRMTSTERSPAREDERFWKPGLRGKRFVGLQGFASSKMGSTVFLGLRVAARLKQGSVLSGTRGTKPRGVCRHRECRS